MPVLTHLESRPRHCDERIGHTPPAAPHASVAHTNAAYDSSASAVVTGAQGSPCLPSSSSAAAAAAAAAEPPEEPTVLLAASASDSALEGPRDTVEGRRLLRSAHKVRHEGGPPLVGSLVDWLVDWLVD